MERRHGLGLRAQIILALVAAFALSLTVLGLMVVQVTRRSAELERGRRARTMASALAVALASETEPARAQQLVERLSPRELSGLAVRLPALKLEHGTRRGEPTATVKLEPDGVVSVWLIPAERDVESPLSRLLRLYLLVTFAFILIVTYVLLTRLIVRPVENLTHAAGRLAQGARGAEVPVAGAAEVARLAVSFNHMAAELRRQKLALEERLAELERTAGELHATRDQLVRSEKLASVGRLSAGIAHEIGNPLAAISGLVELLQLGGLSQHEQDEFLARVRNETDRIHRIIRELLDYSRARPSQASVEEPGNLSEVIEEAVKLIAPQKDLARVTIETRIHDERPLVKAPAHELTQVLLNLLLNAADAVAGEGSILIELTRQADRLVLSVTDSGPGIPEGLLSKVFDPFFTTKPPGKGTGLGLAVCLSLAERVGGKIGAENVAGGGARFTLSLPAA